MTNPIISVRALKKNFVFKEKSAGLTSGIRSLFNPRYKTVHAVDGIDFEINEAEVVAFIGPNGAGKSTTIKMLAGLLYPSSGEVSVLGLVPWQDRQKLAYHIGSVFGQKPQLWYHLPAQDTYDLFSRIYELDRRSYRNRLSFLTEAFEITDLLKIPVRKLSLGQRMRCEIVASLLHSPRVIFLDEPTIGLDVIAKQQIRGVIKHLNETERVTIFLTSHDAGDIEILSDRTVVINHGQVVYDGLTEQFKSEFIKTKTIKVVSSTPINDFQFSSGKILSKEKFVLTVEVNIVETPIDQLLHEALKNLNIQDITINDPDMEEIIAAIYRKHKI